jgi:prepilin-type processing-associated H-X9-DG protein
MPHRWRVTSSSSASKVDILATIRIERRIYMKCQKCGTENPEEVKICRSCGCALMSTEATVASQPNRTSALAITSLVLGLLSFCTFFLTVPLAVIFGIISLVMIAKSHGQLKGKGLAIAGIAVPVVILPIWILVITSEPRTTQRVICGSNMNALGNVMLLYANDHNGKFPTSSKWCDLLMEYTNVKDSTFRCPGALSRWDKLKYKFTSDKLSNYAMNKNIEKLGTKSPPDMVLLFDSKPGWNQSGGPEIASSENHQGDGCNILFSDSHVRFIRAEDVNKLQWTAEQ